MTKTAEERFRLRAVQIPDAVALIDEQEQITYRELDALTDALAAALRTRDIGPERVVAVHTRRKLEAAATLIAVLKAGGVYLPLETAAPSERNRLVLEDSAATLLVVGSDTPHEGLPGDKLFWPKPGEDRWPVADVPAAAAPAPGNAAYILYTSGTTGRPKGVLVARDLLAQQITAITEGFGLLREDRILQFSPMHVDTAIEQALSTLCLGATLVVSDETLSVTGMLDFLDRHRVTVAHLATGYWHAIVRCLDWREWPDIELRQMIVGGDRMSASAARLWQSKTGIPLINAYGPTETVITPTLHPVTQVDEALGAPLGDPIGDRVAYILDESLRECPVGESGELHLGGNLLARCYVGKPGVTANSFIADPFSAAPGSRLYRTGDIVRRTQDGAIYFIGRKDGQLKFRGYRIELGEIDSVLTLHPGVREAAVVVREDQPGLPQLVAYLVLGDPEPGTAELRAHTVAKLPGHMVPTRYSVLDALPLTSNSKVDRRALRGPEFRPANPRRREVLADVAGTD
ncbi:amino acid adenylation domain-containing protein [Streptomyces sp. NPDC006530]|uniref:amino acid adenylation domain-containing protein n=1 Tax=Streptomyces sp. NPDC006530 TaxID=3364750 RepID=UPI003679E956